MPAMDEKKIAKLHKEFAKEDSELAEMGMANYLDGLKYEDKA